MSARHIRVYQEYLDREITDIHVIYLKENMTIARIEEKLRHEDFHDVYYAALGYDDFKRIFTSKIPGGSTILIVKYKDEEYGKERRDILLHQLSYIKDAFLVQRIDHMKHGVTRYDPYSINLRKSYIEVNTLDEVNDTIMKSDKYLSYQRFYKVSGKYYKHLDNTIPLNERDN